MPTYTREQLYNGTTASADIPLSNIPYQMVNNAGSTAYLAIESLTSTKIFEGDYFQTVESKVNCTIVSSSTHASFIISPHSTGSFTLRCNAVIPKEEIRFLAANSQVFSIDDPTSSGSFFGVDLSY